MSERIILLLFRWLLLFELQGYHSTYPHFDMLHLKRRFD
jgi:hypothetical protein